MPKAFRVSIAAAIAALAAALVAVTVMPSFF
jgi:hypothetical protein